MVNEILKNENDFIDKLLIKGEDIFNIIIDIGERDLTRAEMHTIIERIGFIYGVCIAQKEIIKKYEN